MNCCKRSAFVLAAILAFVVVLNASPTVVNFDDLSSYNLIPNGYAGLNWNNVYVLNGINYGYGYGNGVVSPPNVAYNGFASPAEIWQTQSFVLYGGYFTAAWFDENIQIVGTLAGNPVFNVTFPISYSGPIWYDFGGAHVDTVWLYTPSGSQFALDNLTYGPIPEPGTLALLGGGLIGVATSLRRRISR